MVFVRILSSSGLRVVGFSLRSIKVVTWSIYKSILGISSSLMLSILPMLSNMLFNKSSLSIVMVSASFQILTFQKQMPPSESLVLLCSALCSHARASHSLSVFDRRMFANGCWKTNASFGVACFSLHPLYSIWNYMASLHLPQYILIFQWTLKL